MLSLLVFFFYHNLSQGNFSVHLDFSDCAIKGAAVSCSPVPYRLGEDGIGFWDNRHAGLCMVLVHGILAGPCMVHGMLVMLVMSWVMWCGGWTKFITASQFLRSISLLL